MKTKPVVSTERWLCPKCDVMRKSNYCLDCGHKAPDRLRTDESHIDALRQMARVCRTRQSGEFNNGKALEAKENGFDEKGFFQDHQAHAKKRFQNAEELRIQAEALEWAIEVTIEAQQLTQKKPEGSQSLGTTAPVARDYGPFPGELVRRGISKTVAYELNKDGLLETFKIGRKRYVYLDSLNSLPVKLKGRAPDIDLQQEDPGA